MYYKCCVPNCGNTRKDAILHKFPTSECSEYRLNKWLRCLNLQRSSVANLFVCQAHFEKRFVGPNSRLLSKAYPSLFTRNEISSGTPENHAGNSLLREHNYCRANLHYDHNYCKELPSPSGQSQLELQQTQQNNQDNLVNDNEQLVEPYPESQLISKKRSIEKENLENSQNKKMKLLASQNNRTENAATAIKKLAKRSKPTFKTSSKRRLIQSYQKLTPTAKKIYKEYVKAKNQTNFHLRAKRALQFSKKPSFEKLTTHLNPYARKFLNMQIKLCKIKKQGRRFTLDEKLVALSIMKQSPKCYRFLHRIFILPSVTTLNKMVSKIKMGPGINTKIFEVIKKEVTTWKNNKKYCSIIFDEMAKPQTRQTTDN